MPNSQETGLDKSKYLVRIIDDDPSIRESFCFFLEGEGWKTKPYACAEEFLEGDNPEIRGCLVLDIKMPGMTGLELQQELLRCSSGLPIIFISAHGNIEMAVHAVLSGACNFLTKPVDEESLLDSIGKAVVQCDRIYSQRTAYQDLKQRWDSLTHREKEVAELLAKGLLNKVIADKLGTTTRTIQVHRATIYLKLGLRSAAEITSLIEKLKALPG